MSIGKVDSVDLAAMRQAPAPAPITPAQRAAQGNPVFPPAQPVTQEAVAAAAQSTNAYMQSVSSSLRFSLDQDTGHTVVRMIDTETEDVLRQFPSEEMLAISKSIDRMQGLLINREA
ncbi:MAG: flagellar protein FlaG [Thiobacillus sp.]|nr:flagellar protein FlaG [Thiobacillus sp.]